MCIKSVPYLHQKSVSWALVMIFFMLCFLMMKLNLHEYNVNLHTCRKIMQLGYHEGAGTKIGDNQID